MRNRILAALSWTTVLLIAAVLLAVSAFASRDPDSTVYAGISARLSTMPLSAWLVPEWWGLWGLEGPFREHPVGIFILPALLGRAGYPAEQAAYAIGAVSSVLAVLLVGWVAAPLVRDHERAAVRWATLLLPIAFTYRIRANQEYPVLVLLLAAVYATERARTSAAWMAGIVAAAVGVFLMKGVFVVFVPIVCALWLLLSGRGDGRPDRSAWVGVGLATVAVVLAAVGYEAVYRSVSGDSFFAYYIAQRLGSNTGVGSEASSVPGRAWNVPWYLARLIWFAVPGSLVLIGLALRGRATRWRGAPGLAFPVGVALVYVIVMSLGANRADRFIFPAYFAIGVGGAVVAMRRWPGVERAARWIAHREPYGTPVLWLLLFLATFLTASRLPYVQF